MAINIINASIVTIGNGYNPTILHPAFLKSKRVVPQSWQSASQTLSTPLLSIVNFQNGVVFLAEPEKLQIQDSRQGVPKPTQTLVKMAESFLDQFPGVTHRAVGFNPMCIIDYPDSEKLLIDKFLKLGKWNQGDLTLKGVALTFQYPLEHATLRIVCDTGEARLPGESKKRQGILVSANYNTDIPTDLSPEEILIKAKEAVSRSTEYRRHFQSTVDTLFSELMGND